ncbi:MAG: biliverdin-producing heme oxygenase [Deltaproteobacteria bacterium]|nr:biliverdin-producing heme oxygenase [Deltaproteobacteria bacterium]
MSLHQVQSTSEAHSPTTPDVFTGATGRYLRIAAMAIVSTGAAFLEGCAATKESQPPANPPAAVTPENALPLTKMLSANLGKYHEAVQRSVFIESAFAGTLSREQYVLHLQQRVLMHQELDRVLAEHAAGSPEITAVFGPMQKEPLIFVREDLKACGGKEITEAAALPETKAFLQFVRELEREDPRLAIGVLHVFFGGITNGGLQIGAAIEEGLPGVSVKYYTGCTGYSEFKVQMNTIKDPALQKKIVVTAEQTYEHILKMHNSDPFKPVAEKQQAFMEQGLEAFAFPERAS